MGDSRRRREITGATPPNIKTAVLQPIPMKKTVILGYQLIADKFQRERQEFIMSAMQESGIDPRQFQADVQSWHFMPIQALPPQQGIGRQMAVHPANGTNGDGDKQDEKTEAEMSEKN